MKSNKIKEILDSPEIDEDDEEMGDDNDKEYESESTSVMRKTVPKKVKWLTVDPGMS